MNRKTKTKTKKKTAIYSGQVGSPIATVYCAIVLRIINYNGYYNTAQPNTTHRVSAANVETVKLLDVITRTSLEQFAFTFVLALALGIALALVLLLLLLPPSPPLPLSS